MIKVDPIREILRAAFFSGYIRKEQPLSVLLVASPESGKTTLLKSFYHLPGVLVLSDATAYGIIKATNNLDDIESGKVKHLIIPDLTTPMAKRYETVKTFVSFMNGLIEEGLVDISTFATTVKSKKVSVRCGFISATTKDMTDDQRHGWQRIGFLSRMLPISYSYSKLSVAQVCDYIAREKHLDEPQETMEMPTRNVDVRLNENIAKSIIPLVQQSVAKAEGLYGFRLQRQTQTLLKGCALMDGRTKVNDDDRYKVLEMLKYVNLSYNEL